MKRLFNLFKKRSVAPTRGRINSDKSSGGKHTANNKSITLIKMKVIRKDGTIEEITNG